MRDELAGGRLVGGEGRGGDDAEHLERRAFLAGLSDSWPTERLLATKGMLTLALGAAASRRDLVAPLRQLAGALASAI